MDIKLDLTTMDWQLTATHLARCSGLDEVAQQLVIRLKLHRGEWGFDLEAGTPWRQEILGKVPDGRRVAIITSILAAHPKVSRVKSVRLARAAGTRAATIYADVETSEGPVTIAAAEPAA